MRYDIHGREEGPEGAPVLVLSSGLGGLGQYWAPQIPVLARRFRVITYDHLGTGGSPGRLPEGYAVADMAVEVGAMLAEIGVTSCAFMGHALGALIGLRLAHDRPDLIRRLVLVNAWAKTHPHTIRCFETRINLLQHSGVAAFVKAQPLFLYPADWLAARQDWLAEQDAAGVEHFAGLDTVLARIEAILAFDMTAELASIVPPVSLIAARDDMLVPSLCSRMLAEVLPRAWLRMLEFGGHACNVTDPDGFNALLAEALPDAD